MGSVLKGSIAPEMDEILSGGAMFRLSFSLCGGSSALPMALSGVAADPASTPPSCRLTQGSDSTELAGSGWLNGGCCEFDRLLT